jgi:YbbR domain-containing protein
LKAKKSFLERLTDDWLAKVLSLVAAIFIFWLYQNNRLEKEYYKIKLKTTGSGRMLPAEEYRDMVDITLRGGSQILGSVGLENIDKCVEAYIDFSGIDSEGERVLPVKIRRLGSILEADPLEISVDPSSVKIRFEARETKYVPVEARFSGSPEMGFEKASVQVSPGKVEISGPRNVVGKILTVSTEAFSLSGLNKDAVGVVPLVPPSSLVELSSSRSVELRLEIRQAFAKKTFDYVPIALIGLAPKLAVEGKLPGGILTVSGSQADVDAFALKEDTMFIDLTSVGKTGSVILPVQVSLPPEISAVETTPAELQLKIADRDSQ